MIYYYIITSKIYINDDFIIKHHLVAFNRLSEYFDFYKKNSTFEVYSIRPYSRFCPFNLDKSFS